MSSEAIRVNDLVEFKANDSIDGWRPGVLKWLDGEHYLIQTLTGKKRGPSLLKIEDTDLRKTSQSYVCYIALTQDGGVSISVMSPEDAKTKAAQAPFGPIVAVRTVRWRAVDGEDPVKSN